MKNIKLILALVLASSAVMAQTVQDGLKALEIQKMETAKKIFKGLIQNDPQNPELHYYLGTAYVGSAKPDSAKMSFDKAVSANANSPFGYVGLGTLALNKNDQAGAKANFEKAATLAPKNANVYMFIADALINSEFSDYNKAIQMLNKAKELDKTNPKIFVLLGDAYVELLDGGNALSNYEKSLDIDKKYLLGNLKMGETLIRIKNNEEALKSFENVLKIDSTYAPVYKDLGELYFQLRQYPKAKDYYKKYIQLSENNIAAKIRYAQFLYLSNDYQNAVTEINNILKTDTTNNVIYRLLGYSSYETNNYEAGAKAMEKFFTKANEKKILASDYEYYGKLLSKLNKDSLAIQNAKKAVQMDSTKADLYNSLAEIATKAKQYKEASNAYLGKIRNSRKVSIQDYHKLGTSYYYATEYPLADSAFKKVTELSPTFQGGFLWRARSNSQMDEGSKKGLAKPYYEKFIELASTDVAKYKSDLITAYKYLGFYYYDTLKDNATSKTYWLKVKELDPNDKQANDVLKVLK